MTLFGQPTVAELEDLIAAKASNLQSLSDAFAAHSQAVLRADPLWGTDFAQLEVRFGSARSDAERLIHATALNPLVPANLVPAVAPYARVLHAVKQKDGTITTGDLQDLHNRLAKMGITPDYSTMPQPRASSDVERRWMKIAEKGLKPLEDAIHAAEDPFTHPEKHKATWLLWIGGAVAGFFAVRAVVRVGAPVAQAYVMRTPVGMAARALSSERGMQEELARRVGVELPERK